MTGQKLGSANEVTITEPAILFNINRLYRDGMSISEIYEVTRGNWVLGQNREKAEYGIAVYIILAVFTIEQWEQASQRNPDQKNPNRWRFTGKPADQLNNKYIGRRVALFGQNPIRYVNCQ